MLREAQADLPDGIYIRFRTDGSLFNLRRLLERTKTIEELITELLFADDCALLAHMEEVGTTPQSSSGLWLGRSSWLHERSS